MRRVTVDALIEDVSALQAYDQVLRFDRYADLAPHVQSTVVHRTRPEPTGSSSWELHFRSGLLSWTEHERFLVDDLTIEFEQEHGDFDEFAGRWTLTQAGADTALHFEVDFDFGIPSLEGILDPIAERVIKETVAWSVVGLFDVVHLTGEDAPDPVPDPVAAGVQG
jgi:ribosome-associated toxin RatA of RatAB toxin-antitoxin module